MGNGGSSRKRDRRSLAETHPELAAEALFDPTSVVAGTHRKLPWRCATGHEWDAVVKERALGGTGCPYCSNRVVLPGFNDLATTHPELAAEAMFDPTTVIAGSHKKVAWKCSLGHEWYAALKSRALSGTGCPVCSNRVVLVGANDLATTHPELAAEAMFDVTTVTAGSNSTLPWRCPRGHEWVQKPNMRAFAGHGCPVCANKVVVAGSNDLATTHPEMAAEAMFDPATVVAGSNKKVPWKCSLGHEWTAQVIERARYGTGCPYCSNRVVLPGFNDLATTHPELAAEAMFDPRTVTSGTGRRLRWRCSKGHEWTMTGTSRTTQGQGCPACANRAVVPGFNDLATTHPELAAEAMFDPTTVIAGSGKKVLWKCSLGHEWKVSPNNRTASRSGCPICSGNQVLAGFNDLATTHPNIAALALFDPTTVTAGSHKKVPWRCPEGHESKATVKDRALTGYGCPTCALTGYDPAEPGWVYLMEHSGWGLLQIGITNDIKRRLRDHRKNGWQPLDVRGPMAGDAARGWEVAILRLLSSSGVKLTASGSPVMPQRGALGAAGEAWWAADYPVTELGTLMEAVRAAEWQR